MFFAICISEVSEPEPQHSLGVQQPSEDFPANAILPYLPLLLVFVDLSYYTCQSKRYVLRRKIFLDNLVRSLREIGRYAEKRKIKVMLENVPVSNGIHDIVEFKYIIDNFASLFVHLDIPHAFTSGGMESVINYIILIIPNVLDCSRKKKRGQINLEGKLAEIEYLAVGEFVHV